VNILAEICKCLKEMRDKMNLAQRGKKPKKLILNEKIDNFMIADFGESTKQKLVS
jgi:hypothetical protein